MARDGEDLLARKGAARSFAVSPATKAPDGGRERDIGRRLDRLRRREAGRTVLVVEDDNLNRKLMGDLLEVHGYRTLFAKTGREGLALARSARPDLIVADIGLPELSGIDMIGALKADGDLCALPVVAVSAFALAEDEARVRASGCDHFITKPFAIADLIGTIERLAP